MLFVFGWLDQLEAAGVVHVWVRGGVACACPWITGMLEEAAVRGEGAPSVSVQGLRRWFSCLCRSAERIEGRGNAWKLRRLPRVSGFVVLV